MGAILAAHDTSLERSVAIKLLLGRSTADLRSVQRFLREGRALARVVHPGCVQVFDCGTDETYGPYLVMERLEGEDLSSYLHTRGSLPLPLALALLEQLCAAVQAVHDAGIVHRDLKPGNVFVLHHSPSTIPQIKLLDFGIATLAGDEEHLTAPGDVLGTLAYMPPERWHTLEDNAVDLRGDVYALGAILHEMLSGAPPFQAATRAALELAVAHDPPQPLRRFRPDLPEWLVVAVERAMSKAPRERHDTVSAFARAVGVTGPRTQPAIAFTNGTEFRGTDRFRVIDCLARGPDSEVWSAMDRERDTRVAVKRLRAPGGEASFRLKREFRAAAEIRHPNLVRLEALIEAEGDLLLVMELIEGKPFLEYVAGASDCLRACVVQLVHGLRALHARGLVHGDVKSENILVATSGRVVVLDCGLAARSGARAGVRGTPAYLAPEVLEGRIGPEADLYAVGVLLFRALTGGIPADAEALEPELFELSRRLRALDPAARPAAEEVLAILRGPGADDALASGRSHPASKGGDMFLGRQAALATLERALGQVTGGAPQVVLVEGASGIGKTTVLEHFRRRIDGDGRVLVLAGRARQGESIPYPAIDEAMDDLGSYLLRLPAVTAEAVLSLPCSHLAQLFPTLSRVPAIARAAREDATGGRDGPQLRRHASVVLRDLFARLCERQPVVLLIDDLQWIDSDSASLLLDVLGGNEPPPVLVVGAVRTSAPDDDAGSPDFRRLRTGLLHAVQPLTLGPLAQADARKLVQARWRGTQALNARSAARLARQSGGVPFFVELLAAGSGEKSHPGSGRLEDFLILRQRELTPTARRALELVCVSSRPLMAPLILSALGIEDVRVLDPLFTASLVRWTRVHGRWAIEPYHLKIRDAIRRNVPVAACRKHHLALAAKLRADPSADPEALVEHLAGCGDAAGASEVALTAARRANDHLAFDRAASLFAVALGHGRRSDDEQLAICRSQAAALQYAGRRREAGDLLLQAIRYAGDAAVKDALRLEAGTHLLLSGDVKRGIDVLAPALERNSLRVPLDFVETVQATMQALGELAARGVVPSSTGGAGPTPEALARIDLCLVLAQGLAHIDLRVVPFACQALQAALDAGEPTRLQRACALFVINTVEYVPNPLVAPVLALCRELSEASPEPLAQALAETATAENAHFEGDFLAAEAAFERAERTLLQSCPGATRELATVRDLAVFIQYAQKGDFKTQLARTQRWLAQADASSDTFHASMLRVAHAIVWIANDEPDRARAELHRAQAGWSGDAGVLEVAAALYHDIIDRYEEKDLAAGDTNPMRSSLLRSPAAQTPFLSGYLGLQSAWVSLRALADGRAGPSRTAEVVETVASLRRLGPALWSAVADALEANLDLIQGERERAIRGLGQAEERFRRLHMLCLAACARKRRGELVGGELGMWLEQESDAALRALGVANPRRWTRAYWSMFDVTAALHRTEDGATSEPDGPVRTASAGPA